MAHQVDGPLAGNGKALHLPVHLLGKLATTSTRPTVMAGETLALPLIALALGLLWAPEDPLQARGAFPWPWLAPVVLALRYGPMAGLGGACVLLAGWLALNLGHFDAFPQMYFLGGLILVLLVGEFSSLWHARTRRAETLQLYLDQRLEHLVRQHYLLRLSHDRLEQELIGRPMSMRDALSTLREVGRSDRAEAEGPATRGVLGLVVGSLWLVYPGWPGGRQGSICLVLLVLGFVLSALLNKLAPPPAA